MPIVKVNSLYALKLLFLLLLSFTFPEYDIKAQEVVAETKRDSLFIYDEFPVMVIVEGYGSFYLYVLYSNNDLLYICLLYTSPSPRD